MTGKCDRPIVHYDGDADVLYVTFSWAPAARGLEDANGIIRRYGADETLVGVTFLDFADRLQKPTVP